MGLEALFNSKARLWAIAPKWAHAAKTSADDQIGEAGDFIEFGIRMGPPGSLSGSTFGRSAWWSTMFGSEGST